MTSHKPKQLLKSCLIASATVLVACSGGGGGAGTVDPVTSVPPASPPPPPPTSMPPPTPSGATGKFSTQQSTSRFLNQATFGATREAVTPLIGTDVSDWLLAEFAKTGSSSQADLDLYASRTTDPSATAFNFIVGNSTTNTFWRDAIQGDAQLRDRMAFALSQILVVSTFGGELLQDLPQPVAYYQDVIKSNAFGNYRELLEAVTYAPAMGHYLTYLGNQKADPATGRMPDENYAREILQLFSIGLVELNIDGTPVIGSNGQPVQLYTNADITGLAKVFTGLDLRSAERDDPTFDTAENLDDWRQPMVVFADVHSQEPKSFLGTTIPAGTPAAQSIDLALDHIMAHPNVGPFIGRQLIQRFTTSDPSPAYVRRVAEVFNAGTYTLPNGTTVGDGRKGDLRATLSAILLDPENQIDTALRNDRFGKLREPVLKFTHWGRLAGVDASRPEYVPILYDTTLPGDLNQHPWRSKSVFNFYRPGYVAPGTRSGELGMTVPELQILSAASMPGFLNFMTEMASRTAASAEANLAESEWPMEFNEANYPYDASLGQRAFIPNYSAEEAIADDAAALVERLNQELLYGTLSDSSRAGIVSALERVRLDDPDLANPRRERVIYAVLMILASPDYSVQR